MFAHLSRVATWTWPVSFCLVIACTDASGPVPAKTEPLPRPVPGGSAALTINEFTMLEIGGPGSGHYAPQVRVSAPPGRVITVLVVSFSIPGIGAFPPWSCNGRVSGSTPQELNGEVYGSWTLELGATGVPTGDPAVVVTFVDDNRNTGVITLEGRIVEGSFPLTYTGGENGGPCFHGYRPPA
jgi:hypothetical protein